MYSVHGIAPVTLRKELQRRNITIRRQVTARQVLTQLSEKGVSKEYLARLYLVENREKKFLKDFIATHTGHQVGDKCLDSILTLTDLDKPVESVRRLQGKKSRDEHQHMLAELERAGFSNLDELGVYYTENVDFTTETLARHLNARLNKEVFSQRWIERYIVSAGRTARLRGESRVAKSFGRWLETVYSLPVQVDCRSLITPYEVDFYLEESSTAIEFNGDYWHSDKFIVANHSMTSKDYHEMKLRACADERVTLLFVWETDWRTNKKLVQSAVESFLDQGAIHPVLRKLSVT